MDNQQERSLAWLAGIVDGEGSISVQCYTLPDGRVRLTPFVCVANTDPNIIAEVSRLFTELTINAKFGEPRKSGYRGTNIKMSQVRVDGGPCCAAIIEAIQPYLVSYKQRNAEVVMKFIAGRNKRLFKRDALGRVQRMPYSKEEVDLISSIRTHKCAKSSEAICQAPNVIG